jgi:RNA polymerase sigma factor (sigma-70 family)
MKDESLIRAFFDNPDQHWEEFAREYAVVVEHQIRAMGLHDEEFEDMLQEVYFVLLNKDMARLKQWNPERGAFPVFLKVVVSRIVIDLLRGSKFRHRETVSMDEEDSTRGTGAGWLRSSGPGPRTNAAQQEAMDRVEKAFDRLIESGKAQIEDKFIFQCKVQEIPTAIIAKLADMNASTVNVRYHRLKELLRQEFTGHRE